MQSDSPTINVVDVATASKRTGIPERTVRWRCNQGKWMAKKLRNGWVIPEEVVQAHEGDTAKTT